MKAKSNHHISLCSLLVLTAWMNIKSKVPSVMMNDKNMNECLQSKLHLNQHFHLPKHSMQRWKLHMGGGGPFLYVFLHTFIDPLIRQLKSLFLSAEHVLWGAHEVNQHITELKLISILIPEWIAPVHYTMYYCTSVTYHNEPTFSLRGQCNKPLDEKIIKIKPDISKYKPWKYLYSYISKIYFLSLSFSPR